MECRIDGRVTSKRQQGYINIIVIVLTRTARFLVIYDQMPACCTYCLQYNPYRALYEESPLPDASYVANVK